MLEKRKSQSSEVNSTTAPLRMKLISAAESDKPNVSITNGARPGASKSLPMLYHGRDLSQVLGATRFHPDGVKQHTAFVAKHRVEVDAFHAAAVTGHCGDTVVAI